LIHFYKRYLFEEAKNLQDVDRTPRGIEAVADPTSGAIV